MSARAGLLAALLAAGACAPETPGPVVRPAAPTGPRMSMHELHMTGGTPAGWLLTPVPGNVDAGRAAFVEVGCASCHLVAGEPFATTVARTGQGPELTGMGAHHPRGYFVEAILNPNAVLVDGPGWIGPDGRSTMPEYPDLTVGQLTDLVEYLASLDTGGMDHAAVATRPLAALMERPKPPPLAARAFIAQRYDVKPGQLAAFEQWFAAGGKAGLLAIDGLVSVDTWATGVCGGPGLATVFGFRDVASLARFLAEKELAPPAAQFDEFVGAHGHMTYSVPPLYRVDSLSTD